MSGKTTTTCKVLVHNIRSMHNVGSIFRTSDGIGVSHIYLTGYTATPPRKEITKTAIGAEDFVSWSYDEDPLLIIAAAKQNGTKIVLLEQTPKSIDYKEFKQKHSEVDDILFIVGSELKGADQELIDTADITIDLPMRGQKESLNVSVAYGIALYEILS